MMNEPPMSVSAEQIVRLAVETILLFAKHNGPQEFKALLCGGIIANVVANLPDDYWRAMMKIEPCGHGTCDCHLMQGSVMKVLDELRRDHQQYSPKEIIE